MIKINLRYLYIQKCICNLFYVSINNYYISLICLMGNGKKFVMDRKSDDSVVDPGNKVLFKIENGNINTKIKINDKNNTSFDVSENFININTDASLDSEKEKNDISLLSLLRKRLKSEKTFSRFLITFKTTGDILQKKHINNVLNELFKDQFSLIKGICLFINIYTVMLLEVEKSKIIYQFLKYLKNIQYLEDLQILYFSEMNEQIINEDIYFYHYTKGENKKILNNVPCYVDEIWELYINMLNLSVNVRNSKNKNNVFEKDEKVGMYLSTIQNLYEENAKQFIWSLQGIKNKNI